MCPIAKDEKLYALILCKVFLALSALVSCLKKLRPLLFVLIYSLDHMLLTSKLAITEILDKLPVSGKLRIYLCVKKKRVGIAYQEYMSELCNYFQ